MVDFNEIHDPERWILRQGAVCHYLGAVLGQFCWFKQVDKLKLCFQFVMKTTI